MIDGDFEVNGQTYGAGEGVLVRSVSPGAVEWRNQDELNPYADTRFFGRDYLAPATWSLSLGTNGETAADALAALGGLARVWNKPLREPGAETVLRYMVGGRVRRLYGRCRGLSYEPSTVLWQGYIPAAAKFDTADTLHYEDAARSVTLTLLPGVSASHPLPATLPFSFVRGGPRSGVIDDVGGDADAPVEIVFHGPVVNPSVTVGGRTVGLTMGLAYDESVAVDTRRMTVTKSDGAPVGGALSRRTFLADVRLPPGPAEIVFEGSDITGTSTCTVSWRPAHHGF